ncbi:MAG: UvrD-helicase domain-containing protein [Candidatus Sabulitectum sp.]|nr:UvrD-helicase domain-containing protein [Candidatus Sabulitectum sp.]
MISDKAIREAIRNETTRSVVVEASAGTGKTTLVTNRVKALVVSGVPLEKLAVVTFTEAAASELRTRIREQLSPDQRRAMDQAWITTIHGFASRILREYFHLCNGAPAFSMENVHFSRSELEIHWDIFLAEVDPAVLRASSESLKGSGSKKLLDIAEKIELHRWFTDSAPLGSTEEELKKIKKYWKLQLERLIPLCADQSDLRLKSIQKALASLDGNSAIKADLRGGIAANWGGKDFLDEVKADMKEYNEQGFKMISQYAAMLPLLPAVEGLVIPFANRMRSVWDSDPTRLSFSDLLYKAWKAVSASSELRQLLNEKFSHIFIDEFQDTSLVQINLFSELLGKTGLRSKLTVVGDPKQSIFGWRNADIETYKETLEELKKNNALSETIEVNFRSEKCIIDFVNSFGRALFEQISPEEEPFSCDYSPIKPRREAITGSGVTVHRLPEMNAAEMAGLQAESVVALIKDPGNTAVLFRTGTHLDALVQELDRKNISYQVEASRDFHKRDEVVDTASLLRAVLCPSDEFALVNTFRSIFFGINDREITLWRKGERSDPVSDAENLLEKLRQVAGTLPPGPFMETLFRNTCILPTIRESGYQATRRLANMRFILEKSHSTHDYGQLLEILLDKAPVSADEPSAPAEQNNKAVTLTTIHRAKGLAWDHVILVNPGGSSNNRTNAVLVNSRDLSAGIKIAGGITARYDDLFKREKARSQAEFRRLLYVTVTRPRQKLDIFLPEKFRSNSPAEVLSNALTSSAEFFTEVAVPLQERSNSALRGKALNAPVKKADEFVFLYPDKMPEVQTERERQMRLGTEVHGILEFIDFGEPDLWIKNNREQLFKSLEFPEEAIALALNFFGMFDLEGAEVLGREYPLLVNGKQYYIDLLLRRNGKLEVIDYKTDKNDPVLKTEDYREKQLLYKNTLKKITGKEVTAKLVFLHHGVIIEI